jgi:oxygen-independent coproporphyrinogen-3 oxidase
MSGIYIHIPFCKQACHYCDFHFSTNFKQKDALVLALAKELELRKTEFKNTTVKTIYFGGGTPSVLSIKELDFLIQTVYKNYKVEENPEITLEANPDDLFQSKSLHLKNNTAENVSLNAVENLTDLNFFQQYKNIGINRLSIGVQSFFETDLKLMNRAHNASEAKKCIEEAVKYFNNISIDLIYGIPNASNQQWLENIQTALSFGIPHISSYALTVEPKTALESLIAKGKIDNVNDELAQEQFFILKDELAKNGFEHYELSNFSKPGFYSQNNSAYWLGKAYLGIGPSAHSFNGISRSWNIKNNIKYIKSINENTLPNEIELLTKNDRYNEAVMTGLRTIWGVSLNNIVSNFGLDYKNDILKQSEKFIKEQLLYIEDETLKVTTKGQFLCDGIASQLFKID